ncbi:MAG: hypothetical protein H0U62_13905 [Actinobacteria bacterium]|nr:hypothetical protein [Actinomycetota bacterium]
MRRHWPEVLDAVKAIRRVTWSFVSVNTTVLDYDGRRLLLEIATAGQAETFRRGNHAEVVRQALIESLGLDTRVESTVGAGQGDDGEPRRAGQGRAPQGRDPHGSPPSGGADRASGARPPDQEPPTREDDEDLHTSGSFGQPVIESVLGGTVIAIDDAPAP